MAKLLVNNPLGKQEILEVYEGGSYFDSSRVLWDERQNGPLPEITLGAMVNTPHLETYLNQDGTLALDQNGNPLMKEVRVLTVDPSLLSAAQAAETQAQYAAALSDCYAKRLAEYPPLSDFADAMVHVNAGDPSHLAAYYAACETVKANNPKPAKPAPT